MVYRAAKLVKTPFTCRYFIKTIDHTFYGFNAVISRGMLAEHDKSLIYMQAFRVFSQHLSCLKKLSYHESFVLFYQWQKSLQSQQLAL